MMALFFFRSDHLEYVQELNISNTQYSVMTSSKDFMVTALILVTGSVTDRMGGASTF